MRLRRAGRFRLKRHFARSGDCRDRDATRQALANNTLVENKLAAGHGSRFFIAAYPVAAEDTVKAAWAVRQEAHFGGAGGGANFLAWGALAVSLLIAGGLAILTVRTLRDEVGALEDGLDRLGVDLASPLALPATPELARITHAVNALAQDLRENMTRRKALEDELRHNERLAALGRLVAGVAHEVRNPLAAIKLKMQLAQRANYAPEKLAPTFRVVTEEVNRLDNLVRRLLEIGRAATLQRQSLNLSQLWAERAALLQEVAAQQQVSLIIAPFSDDAAINGDSAKLAQVCDNLLHNALAAMPPGGILTTGCALITDAQGVAWVRACVDDTGPGLSAEARARLFEPFFTTRAEGTGLGLTIAREIVLAHGGRLEYAPIATGGAHFVVELPPNSGQ